MKKILFAVILMCLASGVGSSYLYAQNSSQPSKAPQQKSISKGHNGDEDYAALEAEVKKQSEAQRKRAEDRIVHPVNILSKLKTMNPASKEEKTKIIKMATENISDLVNVLGDNLGSRDRSTVALSMYLVGAYRLNSLVPNLSRQIDFEDQTNHSIIYGPDSLWYWGRYPAAEALVAIGFPSVESMIRNLKDSSKSKKQKLLSLWVLTQISLEEDKEFARHYIQREINRKDEYKPSEEEKKNLAAALVSLDKGEMVFGV